MNNSNKIQRIAAERGIKQLYHFTPIANAESILRHGLHSRQTLLTAGVDFHATDPMRLDEFEDTVSLSIHSVNKPMFDKKNGGYRGALMVIELDASILWTHRCRFCWTNAASREMRNHTGFIGGPWAFEKMFEDKPVSILDNTSARWMSGRQDCQPTDIQAEVQVFDPISPELISDITVGSHAYKRHLEALMNEIGLVRPIVVSEEFFGLPKLPQPEAPAEAASGPR